MHQDDKKTSSSIITQAILLTIVEDDNHISPEAALKMVHYCIFFCDDQGRKVSAQKKCFAEIQKKLKRNERNT